MTSPDTDRQLRDAIDAIIAAGCICDLVIQVRQPSRGIQVIHDNDCPAWPLYRGPSLRLVAGGDQ